MLSGPAPPPPPSVESLRTLLFRTWPGRIFVGSVLVKAVIFLLELVTGPVQLLQLCDGLARLGLFLSLGYFIVRFVVVANRRLLWRVRRKLILSYVFVAVVPAFLILSFFVLGGWLMMFHISAYFLKTGVDNLANDALAVARSVNDEVARGGARVNVAEIVERNRAAQDDRLHGVSIAVVPWTVTAPPIARPVSTGPWTGSSAPAAIPAWVSVGGFSGLLVALATTAQSDAPLLSIRVVHAASERDPAYGVVVDVPVGDQVLDRLRDTTGVEAELHHLDPTDEGARLDANRVFIGRPALGAKPAQYRPWQREWWMKWTWVSFLEAQEWSSGNSMYLTVPVHVDLRDIYDRIASAQARMVGGVALVVLALIAVLFLIIQIVALVMGLTLAKSITGSIHELFTGTERVMRGDFTHRIRVSTKDQLGELAGSFNKMTESVEALLQQAAEKRRLEEELRIARQIQMSLLPAGPLRWPGLAVTALCVPAREVGGDYYDFFPLSDTRLGVLIADVAGKGTSAALYMAELKGLVLSLSAICHSPKQLLVEVNRIISEHLDSRSFITMTYAILDVEQRTLTYARAGHTPLIHLSTDGRGRPVAQSHAPEGMVLGLRIEGLAEKFDALLEESTLPLRAGDVFVFFTDGVTEAMNPASDLFGEDRFKRLIEEHGHLPSDELRERILREVEAFVGAAEQHDDMTMILLKVEASLASSSRASIEAAVTSET